MGIVNALLSLRLPADNRNVGKGACFLRETNFYMARPKSEEEDRLGFLAPTHVRSSKPSKDMSGAELA